MKNKKGTEAERGRRMRDLEGKQTVNFVGSLSNLLQPLICLDSSLSSNNKTRDFGLTNLIVYFSKCNSPQINKT